MPIIETSSLSPNNLLPLSDQHQIYCGLDNCVMTEVREEQEKEPQRPRAQTIYNFERALQAPYLEIMLRGFAVDQTARSEAVSSLNSRIAQLQQTLQTFSLAISDSPTNPGSHVQVKQLFYEALRLPEIWLSQKGERKLSSNRETLEKLHERYLYARPFVNCILGIRDLTKQLQFFETEIDSDGRFRTSYNIAGTETGRPSSSKNAFGTGGNAQNIAPALRYIFTSDPGFKLCVIDYEQVEARDVGFFEGCLFNDWKFLDACESGDLHTTNCKLIWPELPWTLSPIDNRRLADSIFYRDFTYRDMSKRGGHLTNYYGTAYTAARHLKVPQSVTEEFQARYCKGGFDSKGQEIIPAYPAHPQYWQWCSQQLQTEHCLTTPFGRTRHFFGRPEDDTTLREAIAFLPQSTTADRTNLGLWRVWKYLPQVQLLAQTYDSITFQYPESADETEIIETALDLLKVELRSPSDRSYIVPGEAKVGWNWGNLVTKEDQEKALKAGKKVPRLNPGGLTKWNKNKKDERSRKE